MGEGKDSGRLFKPAVQAALTRREKYGLYSKFNHFKRQATRSTKRGEQ
jgi:hypothetical protein